MNKIINIKEVGKEKTARLPIKLLKKIIRQSLHG